MFETGVVRVNECYSLHQVIGHNRDIFSIFSNMKVCYMFSLFFTLCFYAKENRKDIHIVPPDLVL